jgi:protocatechuate 3,4-dioxygenase beta subunit
MIPAKFGLERLGEVQAPIALRENAGHKRRIVSGGLGDGHEGRLSVDSRPNMKKVLPYTSAFTRRRALALVGGAATLIGCGGGDGGGSGTTTAASAGTSAGSGGAASASCVLIPQETVGPYPLFNDITSASAYMREDITEGREGVPLNLLLTIVDVSNSCTPVTNALVYVWHCDKDGLYSGYSQPGSSAIGETFCRGVQMTDSNGLARFATVYPGWYAGRITHVHFRVYLGNDLEATSQLAFPQEITTAVYNSSLYAARGQNTSVGSFSADNVFSDGVQYQMCAMRQNSQTSGYDAALTVGIAL